MQTDQEQIDAIARIIHFHFVDSNLIDEKTWKEYRARPEYGITRCFRAAREILDNMLRQAGE